MKASKNFQFFIDAPSPLLPSSGPFHRDWSVNAVPSKRNECRYINTSFLVPPFFTYDNKTFLKNELEFIRTFKDDATLLPFQTENAVM